MELTNTDMTRPPAAPSTGQPQGAPRRTWLAITLAVCGGVLLLGVVTTALVAGLSAGLQSRDSEPQQLSTSATGVTAVRVDVPATDLLVRCGEAGSDSFTLTTSGGSSPWHLDRSGNTVLVGQQRHWLNWWPFASRFGSRFGLQGQVELTLPASACTGATPLDGVFEIGAGRLDLTGHFAGLDLSVGAGSVTASGTSQHLTIDVAAGEADIDIRDVQTASIEVAAGDLRGALTGTAPQQLDIEVAAGEATLALPQARYAVTSDVAVGDFDNGLLTDQSATDHRVSVEVAVGSVALTTAP